MNKFRKALWTRRLNYRRNRLRAAKKSGNAARIHKWKRNVQEAKTKLGIASSKPSKKPARKKTSAPSKPKTTLPKGTVHNHPTDKNKLYKGIDVYEGDGNIDWKKVREAGYTYAFCKTSEGGDFKDKSWSSARVAAMREAGVKVGVYHFMRPKLGRSGRDEAAFFIKTAKAAGWGRPGDLRPVLDFEATELSDGKTLAYLKSAVDEVKALTGKTPIIYTGGPFWNEHTRNYSNNFGCPLWLAAYVNNPDKYLPNAWTKQGWAIWQHTDRGPVPGVQADNVDQNIAKQLPSL